MEKERERGTERERVGERERERDRGNKRERVHTLFGLFFVGAKGAYKNVPSFLKKFLDSFPSLFIYSGICPFALITRSSILFVVSPGKATRPI